MTVICVNTANGDVATLSAEPLEGLAVLESALQEWVAAAPEVIGAKLVVIDREFDRFENSRERLDILALTTLPDGTAKVVVVELKREAHTTTVDLQAIKYAAYCSRFTFGSLCHAYAFGKNRSRSAGAPALTDQVAREEIRSALEWPAEEPDPVLDDSPAVVLLAPGFRAEVLTTVEWLVRVHGLTISCVEVSAFKLGAEELMLSSQRLYPPHDLTFVQPSVVDPVYTRTISRTSLRALTAAIPRGRWISYGDLARALGRPKAALPVGSMIARDPEIENAHRVLNANGGIPPGWRSSDGKGREECRQRWANDGLTLTSVDDLVPEDRRWAAELLTVARTIASSEEK